MADLNQLLQNVDSVPTVPTGGLVRVNPLAAITAGNQAAQSEFQTRDWQAKQAAGQAYQGAIDQRTGEFDPNKFRTLLSQSGPAALAAGAALTNTQSISSDQLNQNMKKANWINSRAGAQLLSGDFSDAGMMRIFQDGLASGALTMPEVQRQMQLLPPDAEGRRRYLQEHQDTAAAIETQLQQKYGTTFRENQGGAIVPGVQRPAREGGGATTAPGSILMTLTPAEQHETVEMQDPRKTLPDGSPNPDYGAMKPFTKTERFEMMGFKVLPNGQVIRATDQAAPGSSPLGTGRYPTLPPALTPGGKGAGAPPPAPAPAPAPPPAPAPAPTPTPTTVPPTPAPAAAPGTIPLPPSTHGVPTAPSSMLQGGTRLASANPLQVPATGAPGPPSPLVSADVADIQAGMAMARARGTQLAAAGGSPFDNRPISRLSPADEELIRASGPKFQSEIDAGTRAQGQQAILANMMADTKQFMTGPYSTSIVNWRARLAPVFNVNEKALAAAQDFSKLAAQLALEQAGSVGAGSDARFSVTQAANPHAELSPASIDLILRQLQGNADYIQARQSMAQQWPSKANYNGFVESVRPLDPRVFQYQRMTDPQRSDYFNAMDERDQRTFMQAHKWAEDRKLLPGG